MAIVKYGSIITEIRGKLGGHVLQKSGQSLSMRTAAHVASSRSLASLATRNAFGYLSSVWTQLTTAQRQTFVDQASTYPTVNKYGESVVLTGYQLFLYLNRPFYTATEDYKSSAVAYSAPPLYAPVDADISIDDNEFIYILATNIEEPYFCAIYASRPYDPPRQITSPKTVFLTNLTEGDVSSVNIWGDLYALFPLDLIAGRVIYVESWIFNRNTGICIRNSIDQFTLQQSY